MERYTDDRPVAYAGRLTIYILDDSSLVLSLGTVKMHCSKQEALALVDAMLLLATHFETATPSTNGYVPQVTH